ncbi:MAG: hypothetical protein WA133_03505 [Syntrophales bacterium]
MARLQDSTGVEERGMCAWGFPRNLGGPIFSTDRSVVGEATTRNNPGPAARGVDPAGSEQQAQGWYLVAKATELRETGDGKSERSTVAMKGGNIPEEPRGAKGTPDNGTAGGKDDGDAEPVGCLNERPLNFVISRSISDEKS